MREELPFTNKITFFDEGIVKSLADKKCILLDLTRMSGPKQEAESHFEIDFKRAGGQPGRIKELVEIELKAGASIKHSSSEIVGKVRQQLKGGKGNTVVLIYGFHEELPELVNELNQMGVGHHIVVSGPQIERLNSRGKPLEKPDLSAFRAILAKNVKNVAAVKSS